MFALTMWVMLLTLDDNVPRYRDRVPSPGQCSVQVGPARANTGSLYCSSLSARIHYSWRTIETLSQ